MQNDGKNFRKASGAAPSDLFEILGGIGVNAIRLRVWVNPYNGWSGKEDVVELARRAFQSGKAVMIDFHYSDFFADPSRQKIPAAWSAEAADVTKMAGRVSAHTAEVLEALKTAAVYPTWIQIGNETRNGMLWPSGQLWNEKGDLPDGRKHFTQLYQAGYDAAKKVFPKAFVMPHIDNALEDNAWWFDQMKDQGMKFDMIALSHYPMSSGTSAAEANRKALANIRTLSTRYGCPVLVAKVGVKVGEIDTATQVITEFMDGLVRISGCAGVFYWEPEVYGGWKPAIYSNPDLIYQYTGKRETWGAYDMGAFTEDGAPSAILDIFK